MTDARERLLLAAERLIAERGPEVPLRDIATAAGQRNNSAVHYYFGSRDGLIDAILDYRMPALEARRLELLAGQEAAGDPYDLRALIECLVVPMLDLRVTAGATHLCRFLEQARHHPAVADRTRLASENRSCVRIVMNRLDRALAGIPALVRYRRIRWMSTSMLAYLADHERALEAGQGRTGDASFRTELIDVLAGLLTAPSTPHARAR
jgi:AcrR family transcriptional regulator